MKMVCGRPFAVFVAALTALALAHAAPAPSTPAHATPTAEAPVADGDVLIHAAEYTGVTTVNPEESSTTGKLTVDFDSTELKEFLESVDKNALDKDDRDLVQALEDKNVKALKRVLRCRICCHYLNSTTVTELKCSHVLHESCYTRCEEMRRPRCPFCTNVGGRKSRDDDTAFRKALRTLEAQNAIPNDDPPQPFNSLSPEASFCLHFYFLGAQKVIEMAVAGVSAARLWVEGSDDGIMGASDDIRREKLLAVQSHADEVNIMTNPDQAVLRISDLPLTREKTILYLLNMLVTPGRAVNGVAYAMAVQSRNVVNQRNVVNIVDAVERLLNLIASDINPSIGVRSLVRKVNAFGVTVRRQLAVSAGEMNDDINDAGLPDILELVAVLDPEEDIWRDVKFVKGLFDGISALFRHAAEDQNHTSGIYSRTEDECRQKLLELRDLVAAAVDVPDGEPIAPAPEVDMLVDVESIRNHMSAIRFSLFYSLTAIFYDLFAGLYGSDVQPQLGGEFVLRLRNVRSLAEFFANEIDTSDEARQVVAAFCTAVEKVIEVIAYIHERPGDDRVNGALHDMATTFMEYFVLADSKSYLLPFTV